MNGMRRFWKRAEVREEEGGFAIALDDRPVKTPAKAPCVLPARALAEAVAEEFASQAEKVDPRTMPLTRAANTTIDRVIPALEVVQADLAGYADSDLLCYRAEYPAELAGKQTEGWDPVLAWVAEALGARLDILGGVMHQPQPPESVAALTGAVRAHDAWETTALHDLVTLSGSVVLGLAVSHGRLDAGDAWRLSRIDEDWQISQWGEDAEAAAAAAAREADFHQAARLLDLLRAG